MNPIQGIEEKALDQSIESLISRSKELKNAIEQFLLKIEHEHTNLTWPSVLDNYALLSSQMSSLFSLLRSEKMPNLQNYSIIPLRLGQDDDQFLNSITESRLMSLNHAIVPDYLRTKPDPDVEQIERQLTFEASSYSDLTAVKNLNKHCDKMLEKIRFVSQNSKIEQTQSRVTKAMFDPGDTMQLILASTYGHDLRPSGMQDTHQMHTGGGKMTTTATKLQTHPYSRT